jgi:hypothetical protein
MKWKVSDTGEGEMEMLKGKMCMGVGAGECMQDGSEYVRMGLRELREGGVCPSEDDEAMYTSSVWVEPVSDGCLMEECESVWGLGFVGWRELVRGRRRGRRGGGCRIRRGGMCV